MAMGS
jgi:hypothetical protein